jgi:hypothetical protein
VTFYVDRLRHHRLRGTCIDGEWCHLATDGTLEELHAFAASLALPRRAFHDHPRHPHYDLTLSRRTQAIAAGALEVTSKELVKRCFPPRRAR